MKRTISTLILVSSLITISHAQIPAWEEPGFVWPMWNDSTFVPDVKFPSYPKLNGPRILIDKAHNNFLAQYFMDPFQKLAEADGYRTFHGNSAFTKDYLSEYDIIIIITALPFIFTTQTEVTTEPTFTNAEIENLYQWVTNGGSVIISSEHAPFDQAINPLLKRFDIRSSVGATIDSINYDKEIGLKGCIVFSKENGLLNVNHPIVKGRNESEKVERLLTFGGSGLSGDSYVNIFKLPETATNIQHATGVGPEGEGSSQCLVGDVGKGKIVVLGDANGLTAMEHRIGETRVEALGMTTKNYQWKQFILNILHWFSNDLK